MSVSESKLPWECPPGTYPAYTYHIDQFNFHKPRTNCESGFGLCIRGHWELDCKPRSPLYYDGRTAQGYGTISEDGTKTELHISIDLYKALLSEGEDVSTFEVGEGIEVTDAETGFLRTIVPGVYEVSVLESEVVVTMDLK